MAQNITLLGASYSAVPAVTLPKTGGGTARYDDASVTTATASDVASGKVFLASNGTITTGTASSGVDVSDTTATASDVASGKYFYTAAGVRTAGTASGGSSWTKLATGSLTVSTTSTSAASAGTIACGSAAFTKDAIIWVHIRGQSGKRSGYFYGSDAYFVNSNKANDSTSTFSTPQVGCIRCNSDGTYTQYTGQYGVYGYSINSSGTLTVRRRYNSTYSLTINDTFTVEVYSLALPTGVKLFA